MIEFTLNRMPEADTAEGMAYGRSEDGEAPAVPFVIVPTDIWTAHYGNAQQINVQLTR